MSTTSREIIEGTLLPIVKAKSANLHGEGIAQLAYALNEYQIWDEEAWSLVKELAPAHEFNYTVVRNWRWGLNSFHVHTGYEHFFQADVNQFGQSLFYGDQLNLFELFNAVSSANTAKPSLGLDGTVSHLNDAYAIPL